MLAVLRFVSISEWKMQKKFNNRLWKSRACVPLSKVGAFHWHPKTTILLELALRCMNLLDAMCDNMHHLKWGIPNTVSWVAKALKKLLCLLGD
jgi:hypothetical protein